MCVCVGGGGFCVCLCLLCITLCPFYFCNRLADVENAVDLLLLSYRCLVNVNVLRLFGAVGWSAVYDCGTSWSYSLTNIYHVHVNVDLT